MKRARAGSVPAAPRIVFVPGVWDQLHAGHVNLLWRARAYGDVLAVGVVTSAGVRAYKDRLPIEVLATRLGAIQRLSFVDIALEQETTDPTPLLERLRPRVLVHGDDWDRLLVGHETVERMGIEFVRLPYTQGISSTMLRAGAV